MTPIPPIEFRRRPEGISAVYLPWKPVGRIDFDSYQRGLERTWACGLIPAINMDTGFANLLKLSERLEILRLVSQLASGRAFVAGAFIEDLPGDLISNYQAQVNEIRSLGGTPIVFQCTQLIQQSEDKIVKTYAQIGAAVDRFLGFELGKMFAPFGSIYSIDTFRKLMEIPSLAGLKHSSLSRQLEWERLALRDKDRPDFRIYTGNDLAIDMIQWGSDYLLGLSAFYPEAFAKRDEFWQNGDSRFFELNDALQLLGGFAFRPPVPAYKHNAAMVLAIRGIIESDAIPPNAPGRASSDREFLKILVDRIARADGMSRFEHIRHKPPTLLATPRSIILALAPMRSNVNLSRIIRLCGCAGITKIIHCGQGKVDREIARDAADYVEVLQRRSLLPVLKQLRQEGYRMAGLEQTTGSTCLYEYRFSERTALIVGAEREGLSQEELDQLDDVIEIPVYGRPFSFNVATATTMAVYEYCKQFPGYSAAQ